MSTNFTGRPAPGATSPWPFRAALATALAAVPLVLFGGSVTTLGAGMAVEGWLVAEGHFLLFFPIDSWLRDTATFVEHTHRLFGALVGLFAILTFVSTWRLDSRRRASVLTFGALLAICLQGAIGGFRVLENDPQLAFLHGALAQAVFALVVCTAIYLSPRRARERAQSTREDAAALSRVARLATVTALAVYAQVVLGAWYRHALRPEATPEATLRILAHILGAVVVVALVVKLAAALTRIGTPAALGRRRMLLHVLAFQVALGVLALFGYRPGAVGPMEWALSIAHVIGGGLLLVQPLAVRMWAAPLGEVELSDRTGEASQSVGQSA